MYYRSFDVKNVGQVKEVYPSAFHFKQEKHIPGHYDREMYEQYQLTVMCNVDETGTGSVHTGCWCTLQGFTICLICLQINQQNLL